MSLGILLIVSAAATLLISDWGHRRNAAKRLRHIAIVQIASLHPIDESVRGIVDTLKVAGFVDGRNIVIRRFNAEADMPTANTIAKQVTDGSFHMVITVTTPILQAVANANKAGKAMHVFGLVTDPFSAGVGLDRENPLNHPRTLVGIGSFLPVREAFRMARRFFPGLKSIGLVWNPAEANSRAYTLRARQSTREMGLRLVEAPVENSSGVLEATLSLTARGVQALWAGGDSTVHLAIDSMIQTAQKAHIPIFTVSPTDPKRGTLFDLGADFYEIGVKVGQLAVKVLQGADPAMIPVENYVPKFLSVNELALAGLKDPWRLPADIRASADILVDEGGIHRRSTKPRDAVTKGVTAKPLAKKWNINIIEYIATIETEEGERGILAGLSEAGLVRGRDYDVRIRNAQGDMATVGTLVDAAVTDRADLLMTVTTPALQAALRRGGNTPIVFTVVSDGIAAGAGRTVNDHLPNVTGIQYKGAYPDMLALIREFFPNIRVLGTLFVPGEVNMVREKERLLRAAKAAGMEIVSVAVNSSAEMVDAALALTSRKVDAICHLPGNLVSAGFPSVVKAARQARIPIFGFQSRQARDGAVLALARDYFDSGREAGLVAARVMRGENPATIPFRVYDKNKLMVNVKAARDIELLLPPALIKKAKEVIGQ